MTALWQSLPDDLWSLAFDDAEAAVILDALKSTDPLVVRLLDVLRLSVRHVERLHSRIDELPHPEVTDTHDVVKKLITSDSRFRGIEQCCCAYDGPDAVCMVPHGLKDWMAS